MTEEVLNSRWTILEYGSNPWIGGRHGKHGFAGHHDVLSLLPPHTTGLICLLDLQPQAVILDISTSRQHCTLVVGRIERQAQDHLVLSFLQQIGIELILVRQSIADNCRSSGTRTALVPSVRESASLL